ncbi:MAG: hypothetical protein WAV32_00290 [Halobacteriota archaeon]
MNKWIGGILVLVMFAVFTLPVGAQNEVYLIPMQSNATYGNTVDVELWVNATNFQGGQINLTYDSACANVSNWERNTSNFLLGGWTHYDGREWITFSTTDPQPPLRTGKYVVGSLTIHCVNVSEEGCETPLAFVEPSRLLNDTGNPVTAIWKDGIFRCGNAPACLGSCCNDPECTDPFNTNVSCKECISTGNYWQPNKDAACFDCDAPSDLCLNYCLQCCNGTDDDGDGAADYPADKHCTCGLDPSETEPLPPIPEASSIVLLGVGLLALIVTMRWRREE